MGFHEWLNQKYRRTATAPVADAASPVSLEDHDRRHHPNGFNPKTDRCKYREELAKTDEVDDLGKGGGGKGTGMTDVDYDKCADIINGYKGTEKGNLDVDYDGESLLMNYSGLTYEDAAPDSKYGPGHGAGWTEIDEDGLLDADLEGISAKLKEAGYRLDYDKDAVAKQVRDRSNRRDQDRPKGSVEFIIDADISRVA